jgi:hypothetical protein
METVLETGVDFWLQVSALELDDHLAVTCPECRCAGDRRVWEDMNTASKCEDGTCFGFFGLGCHGGPK